MISERERWSEVRWGCSGGDDGVDDTLVPTHGAHVLHRAYATNK